MHAHNKVPGVILGGGGGGGGQGAASGGGVAGGIASSKKSMQDVNSMVMEEEEGPKLSRAVQVGVSRGLGGWAGRTMSSKSCFLVRCTYPVVPVELCIS